MEWLLWIALFAVSLYCTRMLMKQTKRDALHDASNALGDTLAVGIATERIDADDADYLYKVWVHMVLHAHDKEVVCACGAIPLHCKDDQVDHQGFRHTSKFCDVIPSPS